MLPYTMSCLLEVYVHCWLDWPWQSYNCTRVPLLCDTFGTSMHRPDWVPTISLAPPAGGGLFGGGLFGGGLLGGGLFGGGLLGPEVAALRALRTEVYAGFLLPLLSNSSGLSLERQESLSRTPQTVIPTQR